MKCYFKCFLISCLFILSSYTYVLAASSADFSRGYDGSSIEYDPSDTTDVSNATWNVDYDEDTNELVVTMHDKRKASTTFYETVGMTISRGKWDDIINTGSESDRSDESHLYDGLDSDWIIVWSGSNHSEALQAIKDDGVEKVGGTETDYLKNGVAWTITKIRVSADTMRNYMAQDGYTDWVQDLSDALQGTGEGSQLWMRFDSIMKIYKNGNPEDATTLYANPAIVNKNNPYGDSRWGTAHYGIYYGGKSQIEWANPRGTITHYNQWFHIGAAKEAETETPEYKDFYLGADTSRTNLPVSTDPYLPGDPAPDASDSPGGIIKTLYSAAGNANMQGYDATSGVPTSRNITAFAEATPWTADTAIWARMVSNVYYPYYVYTWEKHFGERDDEYDSDYVWNHSGVKSYFNSSHDRKQITVNNHRHSHTHTNDDGSTSTTYTYSADVTYVVTRMFDDDGYYGLKTYVAFQYLDRAKTCIWDLSSLTTENDVYGGELTFGSCGTTESTEGKGLSQSEFSEGDIDDVSTDDYVVWPSKGAFNKEKGELDEDYDTALLTVETEINSQVQTANDTLKVKWTYTGGADLGSSPTGVTSGTEYIIMGSETVVGCNFRQDVLGGTSLGDILTNTGTTGRSGYSDLWQLCTRSAAVNTESVSGESNPYEYNGSALKAKFAKYSCIWEKLMPQIVTIPVDTTNGAHGTDITGASYLASDTLGGMNGHAEWPGDQTDTGLEGKVLDGHLYSSDWSLHGSVQNSINYGSYNDSRWEDEYWE